MDGGCVSADSFLKSNLLEERQLPLTESLPQCPSVHWGLPKCSSSFDPCGSYEKKEKADIHWISEMDLAKNSDCGIF
jgi:hypothetical protein